MRRPGIAAGGGGTRYDYDYTAAELEEWAGIATDLARQARNVHVLFNNNARGAGTRNAQELGRLLGIAPQDAPELPPVNSRVSSPRKARRGTVVGGRKRAIGYLLSARSGDGS